MIGSYNNIKNNKGIISEYVVVKTSEIAILHILQEKSEIHKCKLNVNFGVNFYALYIVADGTSLWSY